MKKNMMPTVKKHLKEDMKDFKKEANKDKALIIDIEMAGKKAKHENCDYKEKEEPKGRPKGDRKKDPKKASKRDPKGDPKSSKGEKKFKKVMHEFGADELHSGSKKGPVVTNPKQAVAIAFSEKRAAKKKRK